MSAQNLDHRARKNRKVLTPRPDWSYRGARRNALAANGWQTRLPDGLQLIVFLPPHAKERRRITGNRP